jgi:putative NADPH-quinone reductase
MRAARDVVEVGDADLAVCQLHILGRMRHNHNAAVIGPGEPLQGSNCAALVVGFILLAPDPRLEPAAASKKAFEANALKEDVRAEIEKLLSADALIFQFPLWWFAMPAILKGWVDRVFAYGFAYGVGERSDKRWGDRYGGGTLAGRRAMLIVTAGRLGGALRRPRGQRADRRPAVPDQPRHPLTIRVTTCLRRSWPPWSIVSMRPVSSP